MNIFNFKKVLVINPFGIGDVLFTTPFLRNLKENVPEVSISYIGNSRTQPLLKQNPNIIKVFIYDRDEYNALYKKSKLAYIKKIADFAGVIRREKFDAVFDFSLNTSANFFTKLVGIKSRVGFNYKNRSPLLTHKVDFKGFEGKHVVDFYLDLLSSLGGHISSRELQLAIDPRDQVWAREFLQKHGLGGHFKRVALLPGAGASWGEGAKFRRWNDDNYGKLVDKIIEKLPTQIILMGDKSESKLCEAVTDFSLSAKAGKGKIVKAYGQTTIGQLAALLSQCDLAILNDGGPLHMAVAVNTKTVSIFGPVDEHIYGPYGAKTDHRVVSQDIVCRPCYRKFRMTNCSHVSCLKMISVEQVFQEVEKALNQK